MTSLAAVPLVVGATTLIGCAAGPVGCGVGTVVGGVGGLVTGFMLFGLQIWRMNRPKGSCTDSASIGTYVDPLGQKFVVLYNSVACNKAQRTIHVGSQIQLNGTIVSYDGYTCANAAVCEPDLLYGPFPPHGTYSGSNYASAEYEPVPGRYEFQNMTATSGNMNYYG